ncbi:MAG: hypothetical protein JSS39_10855 [Nitrospira sp.]|nr:hypothetical protein [Nitrospira sp.]
MAVHSEAAEWSLSPSFGVKGVYNSNLILTPQPHSETYGFWVSPSAEIAGRTERLEVSSRLATDVVRYFGGQDKQFTNVFVPLSVRYKTEKDLFGFTGGFTRDNTVLGEELQATGVVLQFVQRNQWTFNPTWTRSLTEKLSLQSGMQFSNTTYESAMLFDYRIVGGSGGLQYQLTERDQIQLSVSYTGFQTLGSLSPFRANYPGINMSLTHAFDESLTGTVYGGPRFLSSTSQTEVGDITARETVWLAGASLSKKFERAAVRVSFDRDLRPSGFGLLVQTNRGGVFGSYALSETLACSLDVAGVLVSGTSSAGIGRIFPEQRYVSVIPKLSWKFLEWWQAEVSYMYRLREIDTGVGSVHAQAQAQAITFTVTYYPPKLSWSY